MHIEKWYVCDFIKLLSPLCDALAGRVDPIDTIHAD